MKRTARTSITLLAAVTATLAVAVAVAPVAHAEDPIKVGGVPPLDTVTRAAKAAEPECVPTYMYVTIFDPLVQPYYGLTDRELHASVVVDAEVPECQSNLLELTAHLSDQAMDGSSPPTVGPPVTRWNWGWVRVTADVTVRYAYTDTGLHAMTVRFVAVDVTAAKTCSGSYTWYYRPGPIDRIPEGSAVDLDPTSSITCYVQ